MKKFGLMLIATVIVGAMALSMAGCSKDSSAKRKSNKKADVEESDKIDIEVGDVITLGKYEGEDITWLVLDEDDGNYLIISEYLIDRIPYNETDTSVTWETCTLRTWLNDEFYNGAFSSSEQEKIVLSHVPAEKNPDYSTDPGNDVEDKVFLISYADSRKYFIGDSQRVCKYKGSEIQWWLRNPGFVSWSAMVVWGGGAAMGDINVNDVYVGVRPAMWISVG